MKPNFNKTDAPGMDALLGKLNRHFTALNGDNFTFRILSGTTAGVAGNPFLLKHGLVPRPWLCLVSKGNAYVQDWDNYIVDVRSTGVNIPFEVMAFF